MDRETKQQKPKRATAAQMRAFLEELQAKKYHEPDSDSREYCEGCGNSPYWVPQHKPGCLVVRLAELLGKRV